MPDLSTLRASIEQALDTLKAIAEGTAPAPTPGDAPRTADERMKALTTSSLSTGGELAPDQKEQFITELRGSSDLMSMADVQLVSTPEGTIDSIYITNPITRKATENSDATESASPLLGQDTYTTTKVYASLDITNDFLKKNIEREGFADHIINMCVEQMGSDLGNLVVNGDTTLSGDPLLKTLDGFYKKSSSSHLLSAEGAEIDLEAFAAAYSQFPDYKRRRLESQLRWIGHQRLWADWVYAMANRITPAGDTAVTGNAPGPLGIQFLKCGEIATDLDVLYTAATSGTVKGTLSGPFSITTTAHDFTIDIDGAGAHACALTPGVYRSVAMAAAINAILVSGGHPAVASTDQAGHLVFTSPTTGGASDITIADGAHAVLAVFGMTAGANPGKAAGTNDVPFGTYMWLADPKNFWVGIFDKLRIYWEFKARYDKWELTIYSELACALRDPDAIVRVDDLLLRSYL